MDILLVEDDWLVKQMLIEVLEDEGYQVTSTTNGQEALTTLQTAEKLPGVILLDMHLPVMNGWQLLDVLEHDPRLSPIPVIIISAYYHQEQAVITRPSVRLIAKPIDLNHLLVMIETANLSQTQRASYAIWPHGLDGRTEGGMMAQSNNDAQLLALVKKMRALRVAFQTTTNTAYKRHLYRQLIVSSKACCRLLEHRLQVDKPDQPPEQP